MGVVMLAVALLAAGWLLMRPEPPARSPAPTGADGPTGATLAGRWPDARTGRASGALPDGQAYTPLLYVDVDVSVGTAPTGEGVTRLLVRDGRSVREPARLPGDGSRIVAVATAGDDLVVADGRVHRAAIPTADPVTEIRSVPLAGGATGGTTCSPTLWRLQVPGPPGRPPRTDLMLPDGTRRIRIAAGTTTPVLRDVGLADRFEVLAQPVAGSGPLRRTVLLYDVRANRSTVLEQQVCGVGGRDGVVWWSTGDGPTVTWSALDLRTL